MERFPDQESCIEHLERIRWRGTPICPHCENKDVKRKKESGVGRVGRWHCKGYGASFKVTHVTVFHGTKIPSKSGFLPYPSW
jgi:transposase-like protein